MLQYRTIRDGCKCSRQQLSLIPLNVADMSLFYSAIQRSDVLKLSPICQTEFCQLMRPSSLSHTATLLSFLSSNAFGRMHNRPSNIIVFSRQFATPGRSQSRQNFTESSSDSDSSQKTVDCDRLQLHSPAQIPPSFYPGSLAS